MDSIWLYKLNSSKTIQQPYKLREVFLEGNE